MRKPEIKSFWFQTRAPRNGDQGAVEAGHYFVADGIVTLCDENGKPTGKEYRLGPGDDEIKIAGRLAREAWNKAIRKHFRGELVEGFNDPLEYRNQGYA